MISPCPPHDLKGVKFDKIPTKALYQDAIPRRFTHEPLDSDVEINKLAGSISVMKKFIKAVNLATKRFILSR